MSQFSYTRVDKLEDALQLIESQAEGHKSSLAYNNGENIALLNIRNIARIALEGKRDAARENHHSREMELTIRLLTEALQRYGNRSAMSFAPPHLQAVIDVAMATVVERKES